MFKFNTKIVFILMIVLSFGAYGSKTSSKIKKSKLTAHNATVISKFQSALNPTKIIAVISFDKTNYRLYGKSRIKKGKAQDLVVVQWIYLKGKEFNINLKPYKVFSKFKVKRLAKLNKKKIKVIARKTEMSKLKKLIEKNQAKPQSKIVKKSVGKDSNDRVSTANKSYVSSGVGSSSVGGGSGSGVSNSSASVGNNIECELFSYDFDKLTGKMQEFSSSAGGEGFCQEKEVVQLEKVFDDSNCTPNIKINANNNTYQKIYSLKANFSTGAQTAKSCVLDTPVHQFTPTLYFTETNCPSSLAQSNDGSYEAKIKLSSYLSLDGKKYDIKNCEIEDTVPAFVFYQQTDCPSTVTFSNDNAKANIRASSYYLVDGKRYELSTCNIPQTVEAITYFDGKSCPPILQEDMTGNGNDKAILKLSAYTNLNGERFNLTACNILKTFPIEKNILDCEPAYDLVKNKASLKFNWVANVNGENVQISSCKQTYSPKYIFAINETEQGCAPTFLNASGTMNNSGNIDSAKVVINKRKVYSNHDGELIEIKSCYPTDTVAFVERPKCDDSDIVANESNSECFFHSNGVSRRITEWVYRDSLNNVQVHKRGASASPQFVHAWDSSNECGWQNDYANGKRYKKLNKGFNINNGTGNVFVEADDNCTPNYNMAENLPKLKKLCGLQVQGSSIAPKYMTGYRAEDGSVKLTGVCTVDLENNTVLFPKDIQKNCEGWKHNDALKASVLEYVYEYSEQFLGNTITVRDDDFRSCDFNPYEITKPYLTKDKVVFKDAVSNCTSKSGKGSGSRWKELHREYIEAITQTVRFSEKISEFDHVKKSWGCSS